MFVPPPPIIHLVTSLFKNLWNKKQNGRHQAVLKCRETDPIMAEGLTLSRQPNNCIPCCLEKVVETGKKRQITMKSPIQPLFLYSEYCTKLKQDCCVCRWRYISEYYYRKQWKIACSSSTNRIVEAWTLSHAVKAEQHKYARLSF